MMQASGGDMGSLFEIISLSVIKEDLNNFFNKETGTDDVPEVEEKTLSSKRKCIFKVKIKKHSFCI